MKHYFLLYLFIGISVCGMEMPFTNREREFFIAIDKGDTAAVKDYIAGGININVVDSGEFGRETPLARALMWGHYEIALHLLAQKNIDVNHVSKTSAWQQTRLHGIFECHAQRRFSSSQKNALAKLLLERGANPNAQDIHGDTPLHCALKDYDTRKLKESVELLIEAHASMSPNSSLKTPLFIAVEKGLPSHIQVLLRSQNISLQDIHRNTSNAGNFYKSQLEHLAKKIEDYVLFFGVRTIDLHNRLNEITTQCKTTKLKELNKYYEKLKDIANAVRANAQLYQCPTADNPMIEDIEGAVKDASSAQEIYAKLCRYYRSMRLMEHAKPKRQEGFRISDSDEWQASKVLQLPTNLMKKIAYQTLT